MKKLLSIFALFSALVLSSCVKEQTNADAPGGGKVQLTITTGEIVSEEIASGEISKTYFDGTDQAKWTGDETMGVYVGTISGNPENLTGTTADHLTMTFSGAVTAEEGTNTVYGFVPASMFSKNNGNGEIRFTIPKEQHPTATSFDPAADLLIAQPKEVEIDGTSATLDGVQFRRPLAILKVIVDATGCTKLESGEKIKSVKVTAPVGIANYVKANIESYAGVEAYNATEKDVTLNLEDNPVDFGAPVYGLIAKGTWATGGSVKLDVTTTLDRVITKNITLAKDLVFEANVVKGIKHTITDADIPEAPGDDVVFSLLKNTSDLTIGSKVIFVNTQYGKAMGAENENGNNRAAVEVTISNESVTLQENQTTITEFEVEAGNSTGTFAFKDLNTSDGKYIASQSNSKNNYLKEVESITDYASWAVVLDANHNATVTAQAGSRNILKYNNSNDMFSCYSTGQNPVQIFYVTGSIPPVTIPVINVGSTTLEVGAEDGAEATTTVTVINPVEGENIVATCDANWCTVNIVNGVLTVTAAKNTGGAQFCTVTLSYTGATSVTVTVNQAAGADVTKTITLANATSTDGLWSDGTASIEQQKWGGSANVPAYNSAPRVYQYHAFVLDAGEGNVWVSFEYTVDSKYFGNGLTWGSSSSAITSSNYSSATAGTGTAVTSNGGSSTLYFTEGRYAYIYNGGSTNTQLRIKAMTATYKKAE